MRCAYQRVRPAGKALAAGEGMEGRPGAWSQGGTGAPWLMMHGREGTQDRTAAVGEEARSTRVLVGGCCQLLLRVASDEQLVSWEQEIE